MVLAEKLRELYINAMKEKHGFYVYPSTLDNKDENLKLFNELALQVNEKDIQPKLLVKAYFTFRDGGVEDFCKYAIDCYEYYKTEFQTQPTLSTAFLYFTKVVDKYGLDYVLDNLDKFPASIRQVVEFLNKMNEESRNGKNIEKDNNLL